MSEPRRWWLLFWSNEDSRNVVASREIIQPVAPNQILLEVIEAEPVLARIKEAEELLKFYARMHDRNKDSFFERNRAREYLKKWEGEK